MAQCSRCHGANGIGDGPDAPLLRNPSADLRRSEVLDSFSDDGSVSAGGSVPEIYAITKYLASIWKR